MDDLNLALKQSAKASDDSILPMRWSSPAPSTPRHSVPPPGTPRSGADPCIQSPGPRPSAVPRSSIVSAAPGPRGILSPPTPPFPPPNLRCGSTPAAQRCPAQPPVTATHVPVQPHFCPPPPSLPCIHNAPRPRPPPARGHPSQCPLLCLAHFTWSRSAVYSLGRSEVPPRAEEWPRWSYPDRAGCRVG